MRILIAVTSVFVYLAFLGGALSEEVRADQAKQTDTGCEDGIGSTYTDAESEGVSYREDSIEDFNDRRAACGAPTEPTLWAQCSGPVALASADPVDVSVVCEVMVGKIAGGDDVVLSSEDFRLVTDEGPIFASIFTPNLSRPQWNIDPPGRPVIDDGAVFGVLVFDLLRKQAPTVERDVPLEWDWNESQAPRHIVVSEREPAVLDNLAEGATDTSRLAIGKVAAVAGLSVVVALAIAGFVFVLERRGSVHRRHIGTRLG